MDGEGTLSHPARGAWIEIHHQSFLHARLKSHPARGAWIEIHCVDLIKAQDTVAPRKGCVD